MHPTELGRLGEAKIMAHLVSEGYEVYSPMFGNTSCDMIVIKNGEVSRVECKSTSVKNRYGTYTLMLKKTRSNKTKNVVTNFDASTCDLLALYVGPEDRVVLMDPKSQDGKSQVHIKPLEDTVEATNSS
jgi:hypothetical protein